MIEQYSRFWYVMYIMKKLTSIMNAGLERGRYAPIPKLDNMDGWKEIPIEECGEPLVPLGAFSDYGDIFTDGIYFRERESSPYELGELNGSLITAFVREGVAKRLAEASKKLPGRCAFLVWDTYRSLETQQALFEDFRHQLVNVKGLSLEEATEEAQRFVSIPSTDPSRPSPHNTGASVDLTIIQFTEEGWTELQNLQDDLKSENWEIVYKAEMKRLQILREKSVELPMGTRFDEVCDATSTRYYEEEHNKRELTPKENEILQNRRMLVDALRSVGFSNYHEEWWHFDFGNQFHAKRTGEKAIYGAATFSAQNKEHEIMRTDHYKGSQYWRGQSKLPVTSKLGISDPVLELVHTTARSTGDLSKSSYSKACRLEVA